jgi:hypothetical protein
MGTIPTRAELQPTAYSQHLGCQVMNGNIQIVQEDKKVKKLQKQYTRNRVEA